MDGGALPSHNETMRYASSFRFEWAKAGAAALAATVFIYLTLRSVGLDPVPPLLAARAPGSDEEVVVEPLAADAPPDAELAALVSLGPAAKLPVRRALPSSTPASAEDGTSAKTGGEKSPGLERSSDADPPSAIGSGSSTGSGGGSNTDGTGSVIRTVEDAADDTLGTGTGATGTEDELQPVTDLVGTVTDTATGTLSEAGVELP